MKVLRLPDFPWDSLAPTKERASACSDPALGAAGEGLVDLSVGTPVDPTPAVVREALADGVRRPRLPADLGHRRPARGRGGLVRRADAGCPTSTPPECCRPSAPRSSWPGCRSLLGLGPGDVVAFPRVAYPTYDVGARLAGATPVAVDALTALGPPTAATTPKLLWLNTPGNPTGKVLGIEHLAKVVAWAREHGVVVASDECYAELDWRPRAAGSREPPTTPSILDPRVTGGSHEGLLCVYSLSKQSNLAGYRGGLRRRRPGRWSGGCSRCASTPG